MSRRWWCNTDFDLTLAHGGGKIPATMLAAAREMPWHFWPALPSTDALLVPAPPPREYLDYLSRLGIAPPRFEVEGGPSQGDPRDPERRFTPFGWNAEAAVRNAARPAASALNAHPDLSVVREVNSRLFSLELERELFGDDACPAHFCRAPRELHAWLSAAPAGRYVAKGNHGLAGIGQFRFELSSAPADVEARALETPPLFRALNRLQARLDGVAIESEQRITREFGLLFRIGRDGALSGGSRPFRAHRLLTNPAGGYVGALCLPGEDPEFAPWRANALNSVIQVAGALHRKGYYGPVSLDVYVWTDGAGRAHFRGLADLNARCSMAWPAHGIAARFPDRAVLISQVPTSHVIVPKNHDEMSHHFTLRHFDFEARRGFIWLTPLLSLARHSLAFIGNESTDVLAMHHNFVDLTTKRTDS